MRILPTIPAVLAAVTFLPAAAPAQESAASAEAFTRCVRIRDDGERLDCYDRLATQLIEVGMQAYPAAPAAEAATAAGGEATQEPRKPLGAPYGQGAVAATEEQFGLERTEEAKRQDIEQITSRHVGEFTGWDGDTVFTLENGQVWKQAERGRLVWRGPENPMITIERGFFGSYMLSVEGVNRTVRVKRVK